MSFGRKRKVSAPGRLVSPTFVDHDEAEGTSRGDHDDDDGYQRLCRSNRNLFSARRSFGFDETIAEEHQPSPDIAVFLEDVDHVGEKLNPDEDEGYNSPNPSPRLVPSSLATVPTRQHHVALPDKPGELTLHYLVCSFVKESERKIEAFARSVSPWSITFATSKTRLKNVIVRL